MELNRRGFFGLSAAAGLGACQGGRQPAPELTVPALQRPADGLSLAPVSEAVHVLKRCTWGPTAASIGEFEQLGRAAWLQRQLHPEQIDDSAVEQEIAWRWTTLDNSACRLRALDDDGRVMRELRAATQFRRVFSQRQLYEVMVEFWSDHFSIYHGKGIARYMKTVDDREVVRPHALGQFRAMLHASARSPAMLEYLDNRRSKKQAPNENYARELLELHTLGVDGGYSEQDIQAVARALTGWTVALEDPLPMCSGRDAPAFWFDEQRHDSEAKQVLGHELPAGRGIEDGEAVLDLLVDHPSTRRFIAFKLCRRFVSDQPDGQLVARVASRWGEHGDIAAMLELLLNSDEFLAAQDAKFSRPQEFTCAVVRALEPRMDDDLTLLDLLRATELLELYGQLGLGSDRDRPRPSYEMFEPLDVDPIGDYEGPDQDATLVRSGHVPFQWPTPDGYPDEAAFWMNSNGVLERWKFAVQAARQKRSQQTNAQWLAGDAGTPEALVERIASRLLFRPLAAADQQVLVAYARTHGSAAGETSSQHQAQLAEDLVALLLSSPYAQRR